MHKVLTTFFVLLTVASVTMAGPKLDVPERSFDFGKIIQNSTLVHSFWLKSVGDDTLRVLNIWPGCGCTQVPLEDSTIAPGDSTELQIILDTRRFKGHITKRPSLQTNADTAKVYLQVMAEMVMDPDSSYPLVLSPRWIDVSQYTVKPRRRGKLTINNRSDLEVNITPIDTERKGFDPRLPETIGPGDSAEVVIIVDEDQVESSFMQSITFEATSPMGRYRYSIPIRRDYNPKH